MTVHLHNNNMMQIAFGAHNKLMCICTALLLPLHPYLINVHSMVDSIDTNIVTVFTVLLELFQFIRSWGDCLSLISWLCEAWYNLPAMHVRPLQVSTFSLNMIIESLQIEGSGHPIKIRCCTKFLLVHMYTYITLFLKIFREIA